MESSSSWRGLFDRCLIRASSSRDWEIPSSHTICFGAVIGIDYVAGGNQLDEIQWSLIMKILLAIDDSAGSSAGEKEVAQRPWPAGSAVTVFSVYEMSLGPMAEPWLVRHDEERIRKAARKQAGDLLKLPLRDSRRRRRVNLRLPRR